MCWNRKFSDRIFFFSLSRHFPNSILFSPCTFITSSVLFVKYGHIWNIFAYFSCCGNGMSQVTAHHESLLRHQPPFIFLPNSPTTRLELKLLKRRNELEITLYHYLLYVITAGLPDSWNKLLNFGFPESHRWNFQATYFGTLLAAHWFAKHS